MVNGSMLILLNLPCTQSWYWFGCCFDLAFDGGCDLFHEIDESTLIWLRRLRHSIVFLLLSYLEQRMDGASGGARRPAAGARVRRRRRRPAAGAVAALPARRRLRRRAAGAGGPRRPARTARLRRHWPRGRGPVQVLLRAAAGAFCRRVRRRWSPGASFFFVTSFQWPSSGVKLQKETNPTDNRRRLFRCCNDYKKAKTKKKKKPVAIVSSSCRRRRRRPLSTALWFTSSSEVRVVFLFVFFFFDHIDGSVSAERKKQIAKSKPCNVLLYWFDDEISLTLWPRPSPRGPTKINEDGLYRVVPGFFFHWFRLVLFVWRVGCCVGSVIEYGRHPSCWH